MPRKVNPLPGANELFRGAEESVKKPRNAVPVEQASDNVGGSGRIRHDEKITVYVSTDELLALEQARLTLRAKHGLAIDRGRLVREAIDLALADLDEKGESAALVQRLSAAID